MPPPLALDDLHRLRVDGRALEPLDRDLHSRVRVAGRFARDAVCPRGGRASRSDAARGSSQDLMEMTFGFDSSALAISIVRTPSLKAALTRSGSAFEGSVNERLNDP